MKLLYKPQKFLGHHFGCVAFVAQISNQYMGFALHKCKAILQMAQIHEGADISDYNDKNDKPKTIVSRMMLLIKNIAISQKKPLYAVLDAFYSTSVAFHYVNESGKPWVHLITRAKSNYVAYTKAKKVKKITLNYRIYSINLICSVNQLTHHILKK